MLKSTTLFLLILFCTISTFAQNKMTVSGVVAEASSGNPVAGATVIVKGTTLGSITNGSGQYSISGVQQGETLVFSFLGLKQQEYVVGNQSIINISLEPDAQTIDEVVVIGYGTSKAKDLTSPIAVVKSEEITRHTTSSPMAALQGKVAGVQIVNTGAPGSGPEVRIRGVGSFGNTQPLYVVDGMFFDNIDFLNNSDIEEISILKDASAASIYGVRAANGVVLVTTKRGSFNRKAQITYDGYVGVQTVTNRLKMASSEQYAIMQLEKNSPTDRAILENSINTFGGDLSTMTLATDTDWYDELIRNALTQNHSVDISGGGTKSTYSIGGSYYSQDGILNTDNSYERFNLRAKSDYIAYDWLKLGFNIVVSNATERGQGDPWNAAYVTPGIIPIMDDSRSDTEAFPKKYASPSQIGMASYFGNPIAESDYTKSRSNIFQILPVFYAELNFLKDKLIVRSQYSQDISMIDDRIYDEVYSVGGGQSRTVSALEKATNSYRNYIIDNTITYNDEINDHSFNIMLGQSSRSENWRNLTGSATNVPSGEDAYLYLSQGNPDGRVVNDDGTTYNGVSFFTRLTYDYKDRYIASVTMRADGSSKYQEKWGYFPSVGVAWILSQEDFMKSQKLINFLKLRGSWGLLGNDKVAASDGFASIETGLLNSGVFGSSTLPGFTSQSFFSYLRWEVVNETNVGMDMRLFSNRLSVELDWYKRVTQKAVFSAPLPNGAGNLLGNNGEISNSGVEFNVMWNDRIGNDFSYSIGMNIASLRNKVTDLNGLPYLYGGTAEFRTISRIGDPMNAYYGWELAGVYQTPEEIAADPIAVENGLNPGDFKYVDQNGDGQINDADRTIIGQILPKATWGVNLGFVWKRLELSMLFQGQWGNQIVNRKRGERRWQSDINYDAVWVDNRWTGAGSTNSYMSAEGSVNPWNISKFNSWYVEPGSFVRLQNLQIAYTITTKKPDSNVPGIRLSFNAERPYTWFRSNGFTPEIPGGFDEQVYPLAATFSFGARITF